jgi:acetyltransferase-like isoleucine patch superfamily enzyme
VDHECILADGVHIAPAATLCGLVTVGESTLIGAGATVLPRIHIGARSIVGAGAVVTRDLPDNVVASGNPARIIRALAHRPTSA